MQRLRAADSQDLPTLAVVEWRKAAESAKPTPNEQTTHSAETRTLQAATGGRAVIAARAMLETTSAFESIGVWLGALTLGDREALESSGHAMRLVGAMAQYERIQTYRLLKEGAVFRLAADGQQRTYQVEIGTVLWSFPAPHAANVPTWQAGGLATGVGTAWPHGPSSASLACASSRRT